MKSRIIKTILIGIIIISAALLPYSANAATEDSAVLSAQEEFTPLYTTAPDSSLKDHSANGDMTKEQAVLFYSQTTALALVAGYLILFKTKGIPAHEKMHRRRKVK